MVVVVRFVNKKGEVIKCFFGYQACQVHNIRIIKESIG
jgi:hypothetical protein